MLQSRPFLWTINGPIVLDTFSFDQKYYIKHHYFEYFGVYNQTIYNWLGIRFCFYTPFGVPKKNVKNIKIQLFKFFECCIRINVRFYEVFKNIYLILSPRRIFKLCIFLPIFVLLDLMRGQGSCKWRREEVIWNVLVHHFHYQVLLVISSRMWNSWQVLLGAFPHFY